MIHASQHYFTGIARTCALLANHIQSRRNQIQSALASYASCPAVEDEIERATYLLDNIEDNRSYFLLKANNIVAFTPRNQLLYATVYMGVIPALMSAQCHVRPPESAHDAYRHLLQAVDFPVFVPNLHFFLGDRRDFVESNVPAADVVIFTGTYANGELVRKRVRKDALFMFSGSGHNPVIVQKDADLVQATDSIIRLCYHNQGQDCSAPNAILVDRVVSTALFSHLHDLTLAVEAEMSHGRHFGNMIGPNTDRGHLAATAETFVKLQPFLVHGGMLDIKTQIISPTIVCKPLRHGPQLTEFFAPVIMLQEYSDERELSAYFGHPRYGPNAMYVTIFGQSQLRIDSLSELEVHPPETVLRNKNLHEEEKGTRPYGGYGSEASFVWFAGIKRPTPILPPREIHQYLVARQNGGDIGQAVITQKAQTARDARFQRLKRLKTFNVTIYPPHYIPTARCRDLAYRYGKLGNGEITADRVVVAGRVVAYRNSGMFIDLRDTSGKIQILSEESQLEHMLEVMKLIDLGDLIGVEGSIRRTKRGELTIAADKLTLLAKDLMPPQKDHGAQFADGASQRSVKDPDSPIEPQHHFLARSQTLASVRKLMSSHDFHDVETAFLEPNPSANPVFELDVATSVSSSVLSLVAKGLCDRAYEILRHIGNRGADMRESIIVDTVQAFGNWHDMMTLTERQIEFVTQNLLEAGLVADGAVEVPSRFPRESLLSLIERETGFKFAQVESDEWTRQRAKALGCGIRGKETWGQCVTSVFLDKVVPKLITPIHVTHLPIAISHAAVADSHDARLAERFVTYINGQLISSGFTLLSDPFVHNERASLSIGWEVPKGYGTEGWAQDFTAIIEQGLPPTAVLRTNLGRLVGLVTKRNIEPRAA